MKLLIRLIKWVHTQTIRFYPASFRTEFQDEMEAVYADALTYLEMDGGAIVRSFFREMRDWPFSVLREHILARRHRMAPNMSLMEEKPLSWHELLAALIIFLLPLFSIFALTGLSLPEWTHYLVLILFWGTIIFALGLALIQKIPRWSLPYLGFILIVGLIMGEYYRFWVWIYPLFLNIFGPRASWSPAIQVVYACIAEALSWLAILVSALILVNLLRLLPYTRSVWQGIRNDWTQLSFLLYGTLVFYITLSFDEYRYDEIWQSAAWLCLAVGAWFYLRAKSQNRRIWALAGGSTAALWIATLAKWILVPLQAWPTGWPIAPSETSRWVETSYTFFSWIGFIFILFAPALLNLLPPRSMPTDIPEEEPIST